MPKTSAVTVMLIKVPQSVGPPRREPRTARVRHLGTAAHMAPAPGGTGVHCLPKVSLAGPTGFRLRAPAQAR
ncbi:hypothetical protein HEK131_12460 [Streptomyces seoulensis]|nr:hypothetical protein HEK131_12460 [Streptomyces seoulensis]